MSRSWGQFFGMYRRPATCFYLPCCLLAVSIYEAKGKASVSVPLWSSCFLVGLHWDANTILWLPMQIRRSQLRHWHNPRSNLWQLRWEYMYTKRKTFSRTTQSDLVYLKSVISNAPLLRNDFGFPQPKINRFFITLYLHWNLLFSQLIRTSTFRLISQPIKKLKPLKHCRFKTNWWFQFKTCSLPINECSSKFRRTFRGESFRNNYFGFIIVWKLSK